MSPPLAAVFGKGIGFPPRVGADGRVAWSEGEGNVRESIRIILLTDERERLRQPDFGGGLTRFLFEPNTATTRQSIRDRIQRTLTEWEPRVKLESVAVDQDPKDAEAAIAIITYRLVATRTLERVTLNVALAGT
jgi:uncharacterized protein